MLDAFDRQVFYSGRPVHMIDDPHPRPGVVLTFTIGEEIMEHEHLELTMSDDEARHLAGQLVEWTTR